MQDLRSRFPPDYEPVSPDELARLARVGEIERDTMSERAVSGARGRQVPDRVARRNGAAPRRTHPELVGREHRSVMAVPPNLPSLGWLLLNQTGFYVRDLAVGELVGEEPLLIEAFDLSQIPVDR